MPGAGGSLTLCPAVGADAEGKVEGKVEGKRRERLRAGSPDIAAGRAEGGGKTKAPSRAGRGLGRSTGGELLGTEDRRAAVPRTLSPGIDFPVVFPSFPARDLPSIGVSA